ncbi:MAG TPA: metal/formaldehyde-sensitive transcriptional repressor [Steroidobacteraceae bacterium]|jgi:DNA-binding FrmR family transcriptional regulator
MSHTIKEKAKLLARVRRIRGQVEAIERALEEEAGCEAVMHLIAGIRGATSGLMAEVLEDHVRTHLTDVNRKRGDGRPSATDELVDVVHTYLR